jgi:N-methylhydantoinase B
VKVEPGDILHFNTWGGGGWGDPLKRDAALVAKDVERGLVTSKGARAYGVVADADGVLDEAGTTALRASMAASRGELPLFNRGGTIEEIKARAKAETGFDPPQAPKFKVFRKKPMAMAAE